MVYGNDAKSTFLGTELLQRDSVMGLGDRQTEPRAQVTRRCCLSRSQARLTSGHATEKPEEA